MVSVIYLDERAIIALHDMAIKEFGGGEIEIRYKPIITHISTHVKEQIKGDSFDDEILLKAAYLLQSIADQHPFFDGNKRTALLCCFAFLGANGYYLYGLEIKEAERFVLELADENTKHNYKLEQVRDWLKQYVRQKPTF